MSKCNRSAGSLRRMVTVNQQQCSCHNAARTAPCTRSTHATLYMRLYACNCNGHRAFIPKEIRVGVWQGAVSWKDGRETRAEWIRSKKERLRKKIEEEEKREFKGEENKRRWLKRELNKKKVEKRKVGGKIVGKGEKRREESKRKTGAKRVRACARMNE